MKLITYNHHLGNQAIKEDILQPLIDSLEATQFEIKKGCARNLRKTIERLMQLQGWSGKIKIDKTKGITIASMKDNVGFCLQTGGNVGRFYADMLKLQTLYLNGKADAGIYILPTKRAAVIMGDNLANFERFVEELDLYKKIITISIHVIGIDI
ncbi:BglII/BstYI family type II restriction endonuclease [Brevibacillus laterosporus]|uniref:BglII/BstYI family type II restriction endonuclease n=1 Tax=Brevibacillus laterosporus TaxID=1465 RepID=UPI0018F89909|nr:BglII/BstYI family type II restriction endonuclease [Brevibacillus laterosporus]MBG9773928.1 Restriction endonuclease BglII [Brevibacillus laterosporus]